MFCANQNETSSNLGQVVSYFPALPFSDAGYPMLVVFRCWSLVSHVFPRFHWLHVFPRFPLPTYFPALSKGYLFSRAFPLGAIF